MRIVITRADGFIGKNLRFRLTELDHRDVVLVTETTSLSSLRDILKGVEFVFHLAGVNRPKDPTEYAAGNTGFTRTLCATLDAIGSRAPIVFTSSIQADLDNDYGLSKRAAEIVLQHYSSDTGVRLISFA